MTKLILLTVAFSAILMGCNPKMNSSESYTGKTQTFNANQELVSDGNGYYSYQFVDSDTGCQTGEHVFNLHTDMCQALLNDQLNHWCAWQERHDDYNSECQ